MNDNKRSPPGLKILRQKQHPVLHSSSLKPCFKSALLIDSARSRCWRHRQWSLKAPLPFSFLFSIPTVSIRLHCFSFSSHCMFHCKTLLLLNPLLELFVSLAHFFFSWALPSFLSDSYTPTDEKDSAQGHQDAGPAACQQGLTIQGLSPWRWERTQQLCHLFSYWVHGYITTQFKEHWRCSDVLYFYFSKVLKVAEIGNGR